MPANTVSPEKAQKISALCNGAFTVQEILDGGIDPKAFDEALRAQGVDIGQVLEILAQPE
jgi:hypothetical protein